jgi:hypothetical protein
MGYRRPGHWQIEVCAALAQTTPQRLRDIQAHLGAVTSADRSGIKRAVRQLCRHGLVEKRCHGLYALVINLDVLIRAKWPASKYAKHRLKAEG